MSLFIAGPFDEARVAEAKGLEPPLQSPNAGSGQLCSQLDTEVPVTQKGAQQLRQ